MFSSQHRSVNFSNSFNGTIILDENTVFSSAQQLTFNNAIAEEVRHVCSEQLRFAYVELEQGNWELFSESTTIKMYRGPQTQGEIRCRPLKAILSVEGITAREFCTYYFEPAFTKQWDSAVDTVQVIGCQGPDTIVVRETHKVIWPFKQRESLFCSTIRKLDTKDMKRSCHDIWMVCNYSSGLLNIPVKDGRIRTTSKVALVCETHIDTTAHFSKLTRDSIRCEVYYVAQVDPGTNVPAMLVDQILKREFPKSVNAITKALLRGLPANKILF